MLTEQETIKKLHITAEEFESAARNKDYLRAKSLYNKALSVAVFMQIGQRDMSELFGQTGGLAEDEEAPQGLFRRDTVDRVNLECCIKRNKAYEDRTCQMSGWQDKYYSDEDYCAKCKKRTG